MNEDAERILDEIDELCVVLGLSEDLSRDLLTSSSPENALAFLRGLQEGRQA
jgi:hypothetical protein